MSVSIDRYVDPSGERRLAVVAKLATILANSKLIPPSLRNKPDDVMAIALTLDQLGLPVGLSTLSECAVVNGKVLLSGQMLAALVANQGHEIWYEERTGAQATICLRRAGSDRTHRLTYTREMARESGALDVWIENAVPDGTWPDGKTKYRIEKFVIGDDLGLRAPDKTWPEWAIEGHKTGAIKRNETWHLYAESMLAWRALRRLLRSAAPDALMGIPASPFVSVVVPPADHDIDEIDPASIDVPDGDTVDAELVEPPGEVADGAGEDPQAPPPVSPEDLAEAVGQADAEMRERIKAGWEWPTVNSGHVAWTQAQAVDCLRHITGVIKDVHDRRRRHAMAVMGEVDVKSEKARHALVKEATGEVESTAKLTASQLTAIVDYCKNLKEIDEAATAAVLEAL